MYRLCLRMCVCVDVLCVVCCVRCSALKCSQIGVASYLYVNNPTVRTWIQVHRATLRDATDCIPQERLPSRLRAAPEPFSLPETALAKRENVATEL